MSTTTVQGTAVQPERAVRTPRADARDPIAPFHAPRPPEAELAASRGLVLALLLVLPFWLLIAALVSTLV
jgi:hypothetical protein